MGSHDSNECKTLMLPETVRLAVREFEWLVYSLLSRHPYPAPSAPPLRFLALGIARMSDFWSALPRLLGSRGWVERTPPVMHVRVLPFLFL
jgi:hypothetical protein